MISIFPNLCKLSLVDNENRANDDKTPAQRHLQEIYTSEKYSDILGVNFITWTNAMRAWGNLCQYGYPVATLSKLLQQHETIDDVVWIMMGPFKKALADETSENHTIFMLLDLVINHTRARNQAMKLLKVAQDISGFGNEHARNAARVAAAAALEKSNPYR